LKKPRSLRIALVGSGPRRRAWAVALETRGHAPLEFDTLDAPTCDAADVLVLDTDASELRASLDAVSRLRRGGSGIPVVLTGARLDFDGCRQAVHAGVTDALLDGFDPAGLLARVEALAGAEFAPARHPSGHRRSYPADATGVAAAAREAAAFLTERGVAQAHRLRIASTVSELAENVRCHAYGDGGGTFDVQVSLDGARVHVEVLDHGVGFDAPGLQLESVQAALPRRTRGPRSTRLTGLRRIEALTESLEVRSNEHGTHALLLFELTPVRFEEEGEDFSEVDFLTPHGMRELLAALERGDPLDHLAPSLALTVGRLLGVGASPWESLLRS